MKKKERNILKVQYINLAFLLQSLCFYTKIHFNLGNSDKSSDRVIQEIKAIR